MAEAGKSAESGAGKNAAGQADEAKKALEELLKRGIPVEGNAP